jgi:hypothetical protein
LTNPYRPRCDAAGRLSLLAAHARARRVAALALLAGALAFALMPSPAAAQSGERAGGPSLPQTKAGLEALTYDTFSNFNCSSASFTTDAVAHVNVVGPIQVIGQTFLNGVPYDAYSYTDNGPDSYGAQFFRPRPGDPPFAAPGSTYEFVFRSDVVRAGLFLGTSVTTIRCVNGAFSAANAWEPIPAVPTGHPLAWAATALLLAGLAARRLASRRRA